MSLARSRIRWVRFLFDVYVRVCVCVCVLEFEFYELYVLGLDFDEFLCVRF